MYCMYCCTYGSASTTVTVDYGTVFAFERECEERECTGLKDVDLRNTVVVCKLYDTYVYVLCAPSVVPRNVGVQRVKNLCEARALLLQRVTKCRGDSQFTQSTSDQSTTRALLLLLTAL